METTTAPRAQAAESVPAAFRQLLANTLVTSVTSSFLWFALTFWVYLESRSVVATGCIAGAFSISAAVLGPVFGTFVDRRRKHTAMMVMTTLSVAAFATATVVFLAVGSVFTLRSSIVLVVVGLAFGWPSSRSSRPLSRPCCSARCPSSARAGSSASRRWSRTPPHR